MVVVCPFIQILIALRNSCWISKKRKTLLNFRPIMIVQFWVEMSSSHLVSLDLVLIPFAHGLTRFRLVYEIPHGREDRRNEMKRTSACKFVSCELLLEWTEIIFHLPLPSIGCLPCVPQASTPSLSLSAPPIAHPMDTNSQHTQCVH